MTSLGQGQTDILCFLQALIATNTFFFAPDEKKEQDEEPKDPVTGLTASQSKALERAKQYAREIQDEVLLQSRLESAM